MDLLGARLGASLFLLPANVDPDGICPFSASVVGSGLVIRNNVPGASQSAISVSGYAMPDPSLHAPQVYANDNGDTITIIRGTFSAGDQLWLTLADDAGHAVPANGLFLGGDTDLSLLQRLAVQINAGSLFHAQVINIGGGYVSIKVSALAAGATAASIDADAVAATPDSPCLQINATQSVANVTLGGDYGGGDQLSLTLADPTNGHSWTLSTLVDPLHADPADALGALAAQINALRTADQLPLFTAAVSDGVLSISGTEQLAAGLFSLGTQAIPVGRHTPALAADLHRHNAWSVDADGHVTLSARDAAVGFRVSCNLQDCRRNRQWLKAQFPAPQREWLNRPPSMRRW